MKPSVTVKTQNQVQCPHKQHLTGDNLDETQQEATRLEDDSHSGRLSKERAVSSIPIHDETGKNNGNWIYPSEQMFFDAMRRKNWNPDEKDMPIIVPIHNAINEECWRRILEWESLHKSECDSPKLFRFEGKPKDYSPKAIVWRILGYKLPFDRHDWTVDRCGTKVEYIIDFYSGVQNPLGSSFYLDVRPRLTFSGLRDRVTMGVKKLFKSTFGTGGTNATHTTTTSVS